MPVTKELKAKLKKNYRKNYFLAMLLVFLVIVPTFLFWLMDLFINIDSIPDSISYLRGAIMLYMPARYFVVAFTLIFYFYKGRPMRLVTDRKYLDKFLEDNINFVIWIEPVVTKTKAAHVITISTEYSYVLHGKKGYSLELKVNNANRKVLLNEVLVKYPLAHYGYSLPVHKLYWNNPETFLDEVKKQNLYSPAVRAISII